MQPGLFIFMSKTIEVVYSATFEVIGNDGRSEWKKIGSKELPEEGETVESIWDAINKKAHDWHKKTYPELYKQEKKVSKKDTSAADKQTEKEIADLKVKIESCLTYDRAFEILQESGYKYNLELKQLVMSKSNQ